MIRSRFLRLLGLAALLGFFFAVCPASAQTVVFPRAPIEILKQDGATVSLDAEWARSSAQMARGLMFRKKLPAGQGMLFLFAAPQRASFWMKNTYIPLDLLFFTPDRRLVQIERGEPLDTASIVSRDEVAYVLELPAGFAARRGVAVGDLLKLPLRK